MENLITQYLDGLKEAYITEKAADTWAYFKNSIQGATTQDLATLAAQYPAIPESLLTLLGVVDGTYWRKYPAGEINFFLLGSDMMEYPYYLLSTAQMLENKNIAKDYYKDYLLRKYEDVKIDEAITNDLDALKWLHFADGMNNGGTSQLFLDFSPSAKGKVGQVIRFLHDPDEFKVLAPSFDDYLQLLMTKQYDFINEYLFD